MPSAAHTFAVKVSRQSQKAGTTSQTSVIAANAYDRGGLTALFMIILLFVSTSVASLDSERITCIAILEIGPMLSEVVIWTADHPIGVT
jgi:hypothetical protein